MIFKPLLNPIFRRAGSSIFARPRGMSINPAKVFGAVAGRSGLCYTSANGGVSWDDLIAQGNQLYGDSAFVSPVVYPIGAGQGLGGLLDRSQGLVKTAISISNSTFDTDLSGWTASAGGWSASGGRAILTGNGSAQPLYMESVFVLGRCYEVSYDISAAGGQIGMEDGFGGVVYPATSGRASFKWVATFSRLSFKRVSGTVSGWIDNIIIDEVAGNHLTQPTASARGEFSRRYNQWLNTAALATQSVTTIATQYRVFFTGAGSITFSGAATGTYAAGSHLITCTAGTLTATVSGSVLTADLRLEADAAIGKPYQRVTSASDYDEDTFPTYHRAVTDDWALAHVKPNGATQALVFWAGQKMSDAVRGVAVEVSTGGGNRVALEAPNTTTNKYVGNSGATTVSSAIASGSTLDAPLRHVVRLQTDVANDLNNMTVNSVGVAAISSDQGTGPYTEQDVYINSRAGSSLFANVRTYAPPFILYMQPGDVIPDEQIKQIESRFRKAARVTES